jgi:apolipoprotein N-acyltransferase
VTAVPLRAGLTPAMRVGALPELVALLALVLLVVIGTRRPARGQSPQG